MKHNQLKRFTQLASIFGIFIFLLLWASVNPFNKDLVKDAHALPLFQTASIAFVSATDSRNESIGTHLIPVTGTDIGATATVEYIVTPGTATTPGDYTVGGTGVLTFTVSSTQNIEITIVDDSVHEPNEFFTVVLRNPVNVVLGSPNQHTFTILNDDAAPTNTPTATSGAPPIFSDAYEPNNTLQDAYTTSAGVKLCDITLWPTGDLDFFRFVGKEDSFYEISTSDLEPGIDTNLRVYDPQGNLIASNDDFVVGNRRSQVTIEAAVGGFYYARIDNRDPSDPADKTYCFEVREIIPPTPTPSLTPIPGDGDCEFNSTIETACTIALNQSYSFDFVPVFGSSQDTDIFRIWMKPGIEYSCETSIPAGSFADTNMIFLDHNGNDFNPMLGNADKTLGDLGSKLSYRSAYTGWLHVMIGPENVPPYEEASDHKYDLECTSTIATATATAAPTRAFVGGGVPSVPTATPFVFPTFPATPTPIDLSSLSTPIPPPPIVQIQPLPTATPLSGGAKLSTINVTIYYDANGNFMPELTEGVFDTAVSLYENASGKLIQFGSTNEAGLIRFDSVSAIGAVRLVVPFLNYTQIVAGESASVLIRIAPQPLPVGIP